MLRNVEVLSCVSGGSIIGAHYYLELKNLLEEKEDADIKKKDYIEIIERISRTFLEGVRTNIRMRVISNWWDNTRLFWDKEYSRSLRLGKLYEEKLFKRVRGYEEKEQIMLNDLRIRPRMGGVNNPSFNPKYDNWRRKAKIPILLLNATTVNTGHNWQFSATWMGESPFTVQKIDANARLRRMYYKPSGEQKYRREIRLGYAVAASSAVPGLFDPLKLKTLYPGFQVSLVDGGVHDNQGIAGLLEQDCTVMLVSDASGQMVTINEVADNLLAVPLRSNDILMERVRNAEYQELATRRRAGLLKGFMFIHLKKELDIETVNWIHCEDPQEIQTLDNPEITVTTYEIRKDLQRLLSNIRTDLDSFNDTEAHALMTSGYLMTDKEYGATIKGFTKGDVPQGNWSFLEIANELKDVDASDEMIHMLDVGSKMLFKIWSLKNWLKWVARVFWGLVVIAVICLFIWKWGASISFTVKGIAIGLATYIAGMFINKYLIDLVRFRDTVMRILVILGLVSVLWVIVNIHLLFFDRLYLRVGRRTGK
jgi:predicted acylesterase/phospholipase RssA